jgi:hypothetical protein
VAGSCKHGNEPSVSIRGGTSRLADRLSASKGLCSTEIEVREDVRKNTPEIFYSGQRLLPTSIFTDVTSFFWFDIPCRIAIKSDSNLISRTSRILTMHRAAIPLYIELLQCHFFKYPREPKSAWPYKPVSEAMPKLKVDNMQLS